MAETFTVPDGDDRAARMLADPKGYFTRARAKAREQIEREIARATRRPKSV